MSATHEPIATALFVAPHFDDVALSCGGTVALFAQQGIRTHILTLFGGAPPGPLSSFARQQHRWRGLDDEAVLTIRRTEERAAAGLLGAQASWFEVPDAIYRDARYNSDDELFGTVHPDDWDLLDVLLADTEQLLATLAAPVVIFVPLAIGNHVDHQIARALGQRLAERRFVVWGYEDIPYAVTERGQRAVEAIRRQAPPPWLVFLTEELFQRRLRAIEQYESQLAFVFRDLGDVERTLRAYALEAGQGTLAERFWAIDQSDLLDPRSSRA
ncbi:PIG-L family deacetylase [Thermomicrobium sp. 4228-Ro]|uniref:PIG-L deacetylase family protein n=1 Tax=Thermomicrobium sp. 4228-Ro TaxID=2993937 RepID=UPI002249855A|nr:PIG-L family deacetylase [Thermomicrobium sp. 4228-Ro]MCX2726353.1 PIG-L family deacetylase [Thermomicrobium sp. 4228-Ro]